MVQPLISGVGLVGMPTVTNSAQNHLQSSNTTTVNYSKPDLNTHDKPFLGPRVRPEESKDEDLGYIDMTEKVKKI